MTSRMAAVIPWGRRGWANEALFAPGWPASPLSGAAIFGGGLNPDSRGVAGLLAGILRAALFPACKKARIPPLEARALGKRCHLFPHFHLS